MLLMWANLKVAAISTVLKRYIWMNGLVVSTTDNFWKTNTFCFWAYCTVTWGFLLSKQVKHSTKSSRQSSWWKSEGIYPFTKRMDAAPPTGMGPVLSTSRNISPEIHLDLMFGIDFFLWILEVSFIISNDDFFVAFDWFDLMCCLPLCWQPNCIIATCFEFYIAELFIDNNWHE